MEHMYAIANIKDSHSHGQGILFLLLLPSIGFGAKESLSSLTKMLGCTTLPQKEEYKELLAVESFNACF